MRKPYPLWVTVAIGLVAAVAVLLLDATSGGWRSVNWLMAVIIVVFPVSIEAARHWAWNHPHSTTPAPVEPGPHACPCCGFLTLSERGAFEICDVCFWEDDGQHDVDADVVRGGPNGPVSLTQARANYAAFGACDERSVRHVRPPRPDEVPG